MILNSLSDIHKQHRIFSRYLHGGDLLILAGDYDCVDKASADDLMKWIKEQSLKYKLGVVFVGGNHDPHLEQFGHELQTKEWTDKKIYYLNNNFLELEGIKIFGSPNTSVMSKQAPPEFLAFSKLESELQQIYNDIKNPIPDDLDILITHTPMRNVLDTGIGSFALANVIEKQLYKPKIHICGHCHDKFGNELKVYEKLDREIIIHHFNVAVSGTSRNGPYLPTIIDYDQYNRRVIAFGQYEMDVT